MIIRVLIENTESEKYRGEHGLSLHIVHNGREYLLDAGATEAFGQNAEKMGIDLETVDAAFLSHGHYDHSGGFGAFIRKNKKADMYAMEGVMGDFASDSGGVFHEIGVPEPVKEVMTDRVNFITEVTKIAEGVTLVPHNTPGLEEIGKRAGLYREKGGEWVADDFTHEMSVVFETDAGLVICNSCSHGGLPNIVKEVKAVFPEKPVRAYIGGLHMKGKRDGEEICTFTAEEVKALAEYIEAEDIQLLYTGHCTGAPAYRELSEALDYQRIRAMTSGDELDIPE